MDFECIEAWPELPEFRVTNQVIRSHELELHLERRDTYLVCPRCQGCCERIKDGRARCIRDLPMLDRPVTLQLHLGRFKAISVKDFTSSDCGSWFDQNVVLGQFRIAFQSSLHSLHRLLAQRHALLVNLATELHHGMQTFPGHALGPL